MRSKILFVAGLVFCLTPWASPPLALVAGLVFGAIASHPYPGESRQISKYLLQAAVVGLGFGMNLHQVLSAGRAGFVYTAVGIAFAMIVGAALGKLLSVESRAAFLISTGTAICGGSAIAAVGPVLGATEDEMSVSLGTVFMLNSVALLTFPVIGAALKLSQTQFGLWAALAIHDTSSVVGACAKYGAVALATGTTVKLARALWIVPVTVATAVSQGQQDAHSVAVVHPVLLPGGDGQHLPSGGVARLSIAEPGREIDADLHAVPDRGNAFTGGAAQSRAEAADPRRVAMDGGGRGQPACNSRRLDQHLN